MSRDPAPVVVRAGHERGDYIGQQGEADDRCPVGQGHQLYTALHEAECETELALYPGASHLFFVSPEARPSQRLDFLTRTVEWFKAHL